MSFVTNLSLSRKVRTRGIEPLVPGDIGAYCPSPQRGEGGAHGICHGRARGTHRTKPKKHFLLLQRRSDGFKHTIQIGHHVDIPQAQRTVAALGQTPVTDRITRPAVLSAIDLNHQAVTLAEEVGDIGTKGHLATELGMG